MAPFGDDITQHKMNETKQKLSRTPCRKKPLFTAHENNTEENNFLFVVCCLCCDDTSLRKSHHIKSRT